MGNSLVIAGPVVGGIGFAVDSGRADAVVETAGVDDEALVGPKVGAVEIGDLKSQPHATFVPEHVHWPGTQMPDLLVMD
jgi:hypothetical protein